MFKFLSFLRYREDNVCCLEVRNGRAEANFDKMKKKSVEVLTLSTIPKNDMSSHLEKF